MHQTLINAWKRQAMEGMAGVFAGKSEAAAAEREGDLEKLQQAADRAHGSVSGPWPTLAEILPERTGRVA